jgi:hypothetical protein
MFRRVLYRRACLLEQFVERGLFGIHLGPFDGVDHNLCRIDRSLGALGRCGQPIIMRSRHQHELAPAVARNRDGLSLRLVLKLAEFALEFQGTRLDHDRITVRMIEEAWIIRIIQILVNSWQTGHFVGRIGAEGVTRHPHHRRMVDYAGACHRAALCADPLGSNPPDGLGWCYRVAFAASRSLNERKLITVL